MGTPSRSPSATPFVTVRRTRAVIAEELSQLSAWPPTRLPAASGAPKKPNPTTLSLRTGMVRSGSVGTRSGSIAAVPDLAGSNGQPVERNPPGRWRPARLVVVAAAVVSAAAVLGWNVLLDHEGMSLESGAYGVRGVEVTDTRSYNFDDEQVVHPHSGSEFDVIFTLANSGSRSVMITAVPPMEGSPYFYVTDVLMSLGEAADWSGHRSDLVPFAPFRLRAGESRVLDHVYRYVTCELSALGAATRATQPVRYELLGVTRTKTLRLPEAVAVLASGDCPNAEREIAQARRPS